ncbi:Cof-type HAD-IIB family hydrolase [Streptococcus sp. DD10]|uniref:Cof-type HAD-IIB family hydrolase n=1 Tax=Streptococcus sp. DD10 TaxID=1777878 RepID=UPI0009EE4A56|nr:Cof-type HAD-IIB family hydrolase [Streptococcus sp. DD10]
MIKRIFSDMDGTLLTSQGQVSSETAKAVRRSNIPFTLVSARAPMEMKETMDQLGLIGPQVAFNGGLIFSYEKGKIRPLHTAIIPKQTAHHLLSLIRQEFPKLSLSYYDLNHWYCDKIDAGIRYEHELTKQTPHFIQNQKTFLAACENIFKLMLITFDEEEMLAVEKRLRTLSLEEITIQRSGRYYLEITSKKAKKSKGIAYIFKKERLKKEETIAFGDGHNDLPMFDMVGYPIVMENALNEVKEKAYKITKSNDEDGVRYALKHYVKPLQQITKSRKERFLKKGASLLLPFIS